MVVCNPIVTPDPVATRGPTELRRVTGVGDVPEAGRAAQSAPTHTRCLCSFRFVGQGPMDSVIVRNGTGLGDQITLSD
eukprot:4193095-Prymnesium_polylepis.1